MIRAPRFWFRRPGATALALWPLGALYGLGARFRDAITSPARAKVPVICVGNPTLGGAGKTPTAIAIAELLGTSGLVPHFLTRGYGGGLKGPLLVDGAVHLADDVGDEPLLLAKCAATHVARDRVAGARQAADAGAQVIVMDDGFQNPTLFKDISFLVVDGAAGVGNGDVFPAGPLRAPLGGQLSRADGLIVIGPGARGDIVAGLAAAAGVPVLRAVLRPGAAAGGLEGRRLLAFCGIGRPEKFFETLENLGAEVTDHMVYADHHPYRPADIAQITGRAGRSQIDMIVTTEKDYVRFNDSNDPGGRFRTALTPVAVKLEFETPEDIAALISQKLRKNLAR